MANSTNIQVISDGPRNTIIKVVGTLDTSDLADTVIANPATLTGIDISGAQKAATFRIQKLSYNVEDGLVVNLFWQASTNQLIEALAGRGNMEFKDFSGLTNDAGAGKTGAIVANTQGWASGQTLTFTIVMHLLKQER